MIKAKEYWIVFVSNGNLLKTNNSDLRIQSITEDGNVLHVATNEENDVVFSVLKPDVIEFFKLESDNTRKKICEMKKENAKDFFYFDSFFSTISISNDLNNILVNFGTEAEGAGYSHRGLWSKSTNKWQICHVYDLDCNINLEQIYFGKNDILRVCTNSTEEFFVKEIAKKFELFRRDSIKKTEIQLSKIDNIFQNEYDDDYGCIFLSESNDKVIFYFVEACGDFCYGPQYIVNKDGNNQRMINRNQPVGFNKQIWLEGIGELVILIEEKIIHYKGFENTPTIIAQNVNDFINVHMIDYSYSFDKELFLKSYNKNKEYYFSIENIDNFIGVNQNEESSLYGNWSGTYKCGQGETGLTLTISKNDNNIIALFNFYPVSSNPYVPEGRFKMTGTINDQKIKLKGTEWINQPLGYDMVEIDCTWDKSNKTLRGIICNNEFVLTKQ